jgi:crotonobetainyl-CoA:carnitine CoA-transferase CaiB-like acyl-CoA transferase
VETRKWTSRDLLEAMLAVDLWCGEIKQHPKVIEDPQVNHSGVITTYEHAKAGPVKVVGPVVRLSATSASIDGPAPMVGQPRRRSCANTASTKAPSKVWRCSG